MPRYAKGSVMVRGQLSTSKPAGAETASATHATVDTIDASTVVVTVSVSAATGTTPTMTVVVEGSTDAATWVVLGTIGANGYNAGSVATAPSNFTGAATGRGVFSAPQFVRTRSVVAGTTPSFTYSVDIEAN